MTWRYLRAAPSGAENNFLLRCSTNGPLLTELNTIFYPLLQIGRSYGAERMIGRKTPSTNRTFLTELRDSEMSFQPKSTPPLKGQFLLSGIRCPSSISWGDRGLPKCRGWFL
jgi:hypothetical protein